MFILFFMIFTMNWIVFISYNTTNEQFIHTLELLIVRFEHTYIVFQEKHFDFRILLWNEIMENRLHLFVPIWRGNTFSLFGSLLGGGGSIPLILNIFINNEMTDKQNKNTEQHNYWIYSNIFEINFTSFFSLHSL